jgi:hypothetical protein
MCGRGRGVQRIDFGGEAEWLIGNAVQCVDVGEVARACTCRVMGGGARVDCGAFASRPVWPAATTAIDTFVN